MNDVTHLEFNEVAWANRGMRGKEFGGRGKTYINIKGRGPWVIHCKTGNMPEQGIAMTADAHGGGWGTYDTKAIFSTDPQGLGTSILNGMFLSDDGTDQWPARGFDGQLHYRGPENALERLTDYYYFIPEIIGGHPSLKPGIRIGYTSRSKDDLEEFPSEGGQPMIHPFTGEDGMWYPLPE